MLDKNVVALLNDQVNKELYSAYLYLDMANYYIDNGLAGFGNWYNVQVQEEVSHAQLLMKYLQNNGEAVELLAIDKPDKVFGSLDAPLRAGYTHECYVTSLIHNLYEAASAVRDFRTMQFLDWFVKEQGEEETNADDLIKKYELFADDKRALYMMDQELAARVFTPPSLVL